jgi:hypothetical protein
MPRCGWSFSAKPLRDGRGFLQIRRPRQILASDPHPPDSPGANVVRNFDPWCQAFDVKDGALSTSPGKARPNLVS